MKHSLATAAIAALAISLASAMLERMPEDMLHTARMSKRAINADGDFHMCMPHLSSVYDRIALTLLIT